HAFAGGCLMVMAHDYRVMRSDRGTKSTLLRFKMHPHIYRSVVLEAKRYGGQETLACHLVDAIAEGDEPTVALAKEVAFKIAPKAKCGSIYAMIKEDMYPEASSFLMMNSKL
ncbi:hypothetical protein BG006_002648, partial [Podila minutissima]